MSESGYIVRTAVPGEKLIVENMEEDGANPTVLEVESVDVTEWVATATVFPPDAPDDIPPAELKSVRKQTTTGPVIFDDEKAWQEPRMLIVGASKIGEPTRVRVYGED